LCDLMMPGMSGSELYRQVSTLRPELRSRFIFMTGGAFADGAAIFIEQTGSRVLDKPFDLDLLRRWVDEAVDAAEVGRGGADREEEISR